MRNGWPKAGALAACALALAPASAGAEEASRLSFDEAAARWTLRATSAGETIAISAHRECEGGGFGSLCQTGTADPNGPSLDFTSSGPIVLDPALGPYCQQPNPGDVSCGRQVTQPIRVDLLGGNDELYVALGSPTTVTAAGGDGHDLLQGGAEADVFLGEARNDTLRGFPRQPTSLYNGQPPVRDILIGGPGNDTMDGGPGDDNLNGNGGSDTLHGRAGADKVAGEAGADSVHGGTGADEVRGDSLPTQSGNDVVGPGRDKDPDLVVGGGGSDVVSYAALPGPGDVAASVVAAGVDIKLDGLRNDGPTVAGSQDDLVSGDVEGARGSPRNDAIRGNGKINRLEGGDGADTIVPLGAFDAVFGGDGNDTIRPRDGRRDAIACGGGQDQIPSYDAADILSQCEVLPFPGSPGSPF